MISPVYATKTFEVTKEVGVKKDLFEKTLTDLTSYKKIFPNLIKDIKIDPVNKNQAKFIIEAQGTYEAEVKSSKQPDGSFIVDVISGDLKGSKITTTLQARPGFGDGALNGATTVKCTLILETSWWISLGLIVVSDSDIKKGIGDGFWELGEYVKEKYPEKELIKVELKEKSTKTPKLEAAKKLDPQKETKKALTKTQTKPTKQESAMTLNFEKEVKKPQSTKPKIPSVQKMPELIKVETVKPAPKQLPFIVLDPLPATVKIGDAVIFSGKLHLLGINPQGATVYIKDEDPFGGDDFMASGIVDSTGQFYIQWIVQNMDVDSVADVYAVFEGSDIHPRLTTCGIECSNTVQLTTLR